MGEFTGTELPGILPTTSEFTSENVDNRSSDLTRDHNGYEYVKDQQPVYNSSQSSSHVRDDPDSFLEDEVDKCVDNFAGYVAQSHTCELTEKDDQTSIYKRLEEKLSWREEMQIKLQLRKVYVKYLAGIIVCLVVILFFVILFLFSNIKFF
ncbi:hypothetical protein HOLleu_40337 [Holothuria leucospilota]|uniref:Transmembrane protein n=1 Tax=Holothuria leucospilota TaxID=206669 RepID=A0A9Q0YHL2_HOLLE|nr:hypothetical protein HOLleu_40337 [Holothuria leucospilota]